MIARCRMIPAGKTRQVKLISLFRRDCPVRRRTPQGVGLLLHACQVSKKVSSVLFFENRTPFLFFLLLFRKGKIYYN